MHNTLQTTLCNTAANHSEAKVPIELISMLSHSSADISRTFALYTCMKRTSTDKWFFCKMKPFLGF